jgi:cell division protein FtsW
MVVGWIPVIGVPLPLLSAGGSALIATLLMLGIVLGLIRMDDDAGVVLRRSKRILKGGVSLAAPSLSDSSPIKADNKALNRPKRPITPSRTQDGS